MLAAGRKIDGFDFRYWKRSLMGGRVAIVHNVNNQGLNRFTKKAHDLPQDRSPLYALVMTWIKDADSGRTSHSKGWGGDFKGVKGDGRDSDQTDDVKSTIEIITEWTAAYKAVADHLGVIRLPKQTGLHFIEFLNILDLAGVRYGVQHGQDDLKAMRESYKVHSPKSKQNSLMYHVEKYTENSEISQDDLQYSNDRLY